MTFPLPKSPNFKDLSDQEFERLTVIAYRGLNKRGNSLWLCRCVCGVEKVIVRYRLVSGASKSCGCLQKETVSARSTKHGLSGTPAYWAWVNMLQRCQNPKHSAFADYGGRGIKVCERWQKVENFIADMGEPPPGMTLDRRENDGDYCPENCRWATRSEQRRNTRSNRILTFEGRSLCVVEWAEILGIKANTIHTRLRLGWSVEKTLSTPVIIKE